MALVGELDLPVFDYTDPSLRGERFHATMLDLAERSWLASSPLGYFVLDREAATFFLRTKSVQFPGMKVAEAFGITEGPLFEEMRRNIIHIEGDDHRRLRNLVNPAFTPRAADRHRPAMREHLDSLLAPVLAEGRCEFVSAVANPYPALAIATVLGAPLGDAGRLAHWSKWIQKQFDVVAVMEQRAEIEQACVELYDYLDELLARRRQNPSDDLISTLLGLEDGGDRLSEVECVNLVVNVILGGIDTTQAQLAHAVRLLAEHPDQWALVREDPETLAPRAVEEALRFEPITPFTARMTVEEVEYRDVTFPPDTLLMISSFNGNRDASVIDEPNRFDLRADRGPHKPLTFGAGIHYCLGANLARAELQEALLYLARNVRTLELEGAPVFEPAQGIYGIEHLPLRLAAG